MGSGDLNLKKSWHPATFKNRQKLETRERAAQEEARKLELLLKEKEQEREQEHIRSLAAAHRTPGQGPAKGPRVDWMYEQPKVETQKPSVSVVYGSSDDSHSTNANTSGNGPALLLDDSKEAFLLGKRPIAEVLAGTSSTGASKPLASRGSHSRSGADALGRGGAMGDVFGGLSASNKGKDAARKAAEDPMSSGNTTTTNPTTMGIRGEIDALVGAHMKQKKLKTTHSDRKPQYTQNNSEKKEKREKKESEVAAEKVLHSVAEGAMARVRKVVEARKLNAKKT